VSGFQASPAQRRKAQASVCRACGGLGSDPAHIIPRSLGGCDEDLCVIPLCRAHHRAYDEHNLDVLALLTHDEQAHTVAHVGLISALQRTTNLRWEPTREAA
jgi:hypothetical protein